MADDLSLEIDKRTIEKIVAQLSPDAFMRATLRGMQRGVNRIWERIPPYPDPPAGSTYRRTGNLGRANYAKAAIEGDDVIGRVGNNMRYAPYVIGDDQTQAKVHQGRWYQLPVVVKDNLDEVRDAIEAEWQSAMNGNS